MVGGPRPPVAHRGVSCALNYMPQRHVGDSQSSIDACCGAVAVGHMMVLSLVLHAACMQPMVRVCVGNGVVAQALVAMLPLYVRSIIYSRRRRGERWLLTVAMVPGCFASGSGP